MEKLKIEAEVELKKSRLRPLPIPGGPVRKVQTLEIPSFHTLTNIRIKWIDTERGLRVMPFQISWDPSLGHRI